MTLITVSNFRMHATSASFFWLPSRDESLIARFDHRIATRGHKRRHVQHRTDRRTTALHNASTAERACIAAERRDPGEFRNLAARQPTEFWYPRV